MSERVFEAMSSDKIARMVASANRRVVLAVPSLWKTVAEELIATADRLDEENVTAIIDCDEEVFRLGYGEIGAVK